jgi:hypothetical protein
VLKVLILCFNLLPVFSLFVLFLGCFGWNGRISTKRNVKRIIPVGKLPFGDEIFPLLVVVLALMNEMLKC